MAKQYLNCPVPKVTRSSTPAFSVSAARLCAVFAQVEQEVDWVMALTRVVVAALAPVFVEVAGMALEIVRAVVASAQKLVAAVVQVLPAL